MKKTLLLSLTICAGALISNAAVFNVTNAGQTFSPAALTITDNDSVQFSIASNHNAVEVDSATWAAGQNTAMSGGFNLPFGANGAAGLLPNLSVGIHYYVCQPHVPGMKAKITVTSTTSIANNNATPALRFYPNPIKDNFTLELTGAEKWVKIYDLTGSLVAEYNALNAGKFTIDALATKAAGTYFVAIVSKENITNFKVVKE